MVVLVAVTLLAGSVVVVTSCLMTLASSCRGASYVVIRRCVLVGGLETKAVISGWAEDFTYVQMLVWSSDGVKRIVVDYINRRIANWNFRVASLEYD